MSYTVTVNSADSGYALPHSGLYTVSASVVLTDAQYENIDPHYLATHLTVTSSDPGVAVPNPAATHVGGTSVAGYCGAEASGDALPQGVGTVITSWSVDEALTGVSFDPDGTVHFSMPSLYQVRMLAIVTGVGVTAVEGGTTGGMFGGENNPTRLSTAPDNCITDWLFIPGPGVTNKFTLSPAGADGVLSYAGLDIIRLA